MRSDHSPLLETLEHRRMLYAELPAPVGIDYLRGVAPQLVAVDGDRMYFAGDFTRVGPHYSPDIFAYDTALEAVVPVRLPGSSRVTGGISTPEGGFYLQVEQLSPDQGGSGNVSDIVRFDGSDWINLGGPVAGSSAAIVNVDPLGRLWVATGGGTAPPYYNRYFRRESGNWVEASVDESAAVWSYGFTPGSGLPRPRYQQLFRLNGAPVKSPADLSSLTVDGATLSFWPQFAQFGSRAYAFAVAHPSSAIQTPGGLYRFNWASSRWELLAAIGTPSSWTGGQGGGLYRWDEHGFVAGVDQFYDPDWYVAFGSARSFFDDIAGVGFTTTVTPRDQEQGRTPWSQEARATPVPTPDGRVMGAAFGKVTFGGHDPATGAFRLSHWAPPPNDLTGPGVPNDFRFTTGHRIEFTAPSDSDLLGVLVVRRDPLTPPITPQPGYEYSTQFPKAGSASADVLHASRITPGQRVITEILSASEKTAHVGALDVFLYDVYGNYTLVHSVERAREAQPVVMVVPSLAGSLPRFDLSDQTVALAQALDFVSNPGYPPAKLYPEQVNKAYNQLLEQLDGVGGYRLGENLIFAAYDWRLPVAPRDAVDGEISLSSLNIADEIYTYAVEYMVYWMEKARSGYLAQYGDLDGFTVHLIGHGLGGLVARAFVQSDVYRDVYRSQVSRVTNVGVPHLGVVDAFFYRDRPVRDLLDGLDARADADSQEILEILRQGVEAAGLADSPVREWVPGIDDYIPTFDFIKRGPDGFPPPASEYDNPFLDDLNKAANRFTGMIGGPVVNLYAKGVDTPYQVYFAFQGRELRSSLDGDGFATLASTAATGFGEPALVSETSSYDQRDLINDGDMIERIKTLTSVATRGIGAETVAIGRYYSTDADGFEFTITYHHVDDLDIASFDGGDIAVTGPSGTPLMPKLVRVSDASIFGPIRTVVYRVDVPGGWSPTWHGVYRFALRADQVRTYKDVALQAADAGRLKLGPAEFRSAEDQFGTLWQDASVGGFVNGDWIERELKASVPDVARGEGYWGGVSYWFQNSKGETWTLWHGGPVHTSTTRPGEMRWLLTNLTEAAGLSGEMRFLDGSISGITTGWNAFSVQGIQDGKLFSLWWSPEASAGAYVDTDGTQKQGKGWGRRGNGWSLSNISDNLTPINAATTAPPVELRPFTRSQGNSRTDFDPRTSWYTANNGMSVVVVDTADRVYIATFNVWQRPVAGARPDLNGQWLVERLGDMPSLDMLGVRGQLSAFDQQFIDAAR